MVLPLCLKAIGKRGTDPAKNRRQRENKNKEFAANKFKE
jgi:hypothetical protein